MLEHDFLCESLKGRVTYFATRYRTAHDHTGRVCVLVDKKEILNMPYETQFEIYRLMYYAVIESEHRGNRLYDRIKEDLEHQGQFIAWDFGYACDEYFNNSINKSLESENMLVCMLAVMDRRVGKRKLEHLSAGISNLPEWLQYFYNLRINSEFNSKNSEGVL